MSTWTVTLSWNDGTAQSIDLHNYSGDDLVLDDGFSKTETLHKDLKPVQDRCSFAITWNQAIASAILAIDPELIITVEITKDTAAWFYGYLRPVTAWQITNEADSRIEFEALDNSWRLKRKLDNSYEAVSVTVSTAVEALLADAGYAAGDYIVHTISTVIGYVAEGTEERDYYTILSELLYSYGYTFYFDEAGKFRTYDWSVSAAPTPVATFDDAKMISDLQVDRQIDDYDGVDVPYYSLRSNRWVITEHEKNYLEDNETGTLSTSANHQLRDEIGDGRIVGISGRWLYLRHGIITTSHSGLVFSIPETIYVGTGTTTRRLTYRRRIGTAIAETDHDITTVVGGDLFRSTVSIAVANTGDLVFSKHAFLNWYVSANVLHVQKNEPFRTNASAKKALTVRGEYIYNVASAERIANIIERRTKNSQYRYTTQSREVYGVGAYVTLQNQYLNVSTVARIIEREFVDVDAEIYRYSLEGVAELGALFGAIIDGGVSITLSPGAQSSADAGAAAGLSPDGNLLTAIQGNILNADFEPSNSGLYMSAEYLGFYDADVGDWVARIQNDSGVGKAKFGTGDRYMEWDGTNLNIQGNAQSANFATGTTGWRIQVDGDAEFNDVTVRGTIEAATGEIGAWVIADPDLRDTDSRILLRPDLRRVEIRDALDVLRIALGYLSGIGTYSGTEYGLYIASGNEVRIEGGAEFVDGDYRIESDAAYVVYDSLGDEAARFGSLLVGDVGLSIGNYAVRHLMIDSGDNYMLDTDGDRMVGTTLDETVSGLLYSLADDELRISGDLVAAGGTFQGDLVAAGGTFQGDLVAAGGTFQGDLVAAGGTFQGELTAGAVVTGGVTIQAGGSMQSDNYVPDTAGWRITDTGIEIDDGTFRGDITGGTIDIGGGNFTVSSGGDVVANSIDIAGGEISGDLDIGPDGEIRSSDPIIFGSDSYTALFNSEQISSFAAIDAGGGSTFFYGARLRRGRVFIAQTFETEWEYFVDGNSLKVRGRSAGSSDAWQNFTIATVT